MNRTPEFTNGRLLEIEQILPSETKFTKKQIFKLCQAFSAHETFLQSESSFAHSDLAKKLMMQKNNNIT